MSSNLDGILLVNKKKGMTSYDVIRKIKFAFKEMDIKTKIGHSGTLDPFAEGLLIVLLGKYTRMSDYLMDLEKTYSGTFIQGVGTDTLDLDGEVIETTKTLEPSVILSNISNFIGEQMQVPPFYSALKHNGKKLYEYARKGENITKSPRKIFVYDLSIKKESSESFSFVTLVSKGTYVRKLIYDYTMSLGVASYLTSLKREKMGEFSLEDARVIEEITPENIEKNLMTIDDINLPYKRIKLSEREREKLSNGIRIDTEREDIDVALLESEGTVFAFGGVKDGQIYTRFFI